MIGFSGVSSEIHSVLLDRVDISSNQDALGSHASGGGGVHIDVHDWAVVRMIGCTINDNTAGTTPPSHRPRVGFNSPQARSK